MVRINKPHLKGINRVGFSVYLHDLKGYCYSKQRVFKGMAEKGSSEADCMTYALCLATSVAYADIKSMISGALIEMENALIIDSGQDEGVGQ